MRIKEIEWIDRTDRKVLSWFNSSLPFRHEARVAKSPDEWFRWSIHRGTSLIVCGMAPTVDLAKEECQKAWEEIVKAALEPIALYVISTEEGIDSICTSADEAKLRQQEVMACSGCMEGFVIVEEFVVDLDGNVTEVEYEEE